MVRGRGISGRGGAGGLKRRAASPAADWRDAADWKDWSVIFSLSHSLSLYFLSLFCVFRSLISSLIFPLLLSLVIFFFSVILHSQRIVNLFSLSLFFSVLCIILWTSLQFLIRILLNLKTDEFFHLFLSSRFVFLFVLSVQSLQKPTKRLPFHNNGLGKVDDRRAIFLFFFFFF